MRGKSFLALNKLKGEKIIFQKPTNYTKCRSSSYIILAIVLFLLVFIDFSSNLNLTKDIKSTCYLAGKSLHKNKPCQKKYILLTTQRSGSTWTCELLDQQNGLACGVPRAKVQNKAELLIKYSFKTNDGTISTVEWSTYKQDLDAAFNEVCRTNPATSIGFKLMYNQIPPQFMADGSFESYLKEYGVSILHLVREAKILKLASAYNNRHQKKKLKSMHTKNASIIALYRDTPKMPWTNGTINEMLELEDISVKWQTKIHFMPLVPDYYLSYESLLVEEERREYLRQVFNFLSPATAVEGQQGSMRKDEIQDNSTLLQLHEPLCTDRIERYELFRNQPLVHGSRSIAACDLIYYHFGNPRTKI